MLLCTISPILISFFIFEQDSTGKDIIVINNYALRCLHFTYKHVECMGRMSNKREFWGK